jgi:hypothetical protein
MKEILGFMDSYFKDSNSFSPTNIQVVTSYIISQSKNLDKEKGTGSSSLIPFLKTVRDETMESLVNK